MPTALVDNEIFIDFDELGIACDSEGVTLSKGQQDFFKNSKCRDEYGALFLAYNASNTEFEVFDFSRAGSGGGSIFGKGAYFSAYPDNISDYGSIIREYYLNLENPFIFKAEDSEEECLENVNNFIKVLKFNKYPVTEDLRDILIEDILENAGGLDTMIELTCGTDKITDYLTKCGFDGIVNLDVCDFVAYRPNQIKLKQNLNPTTSDSIIK